MESISFDNSNALSYIINHAVRGVRIYALTNQSDLDIAYGCHKSGFSMMGDAMVYDEANNLFWNISGGVRRVIITHPQLLQMNSNTNSTSVLGPIDPNQEFECATCKTLSTNSRQCDKCKQAHYCSRTCQRKNRKAHGKICKSNK